MISSPSHLLNLSSLNNLLVDNSIGCAVFNESKTFSDVVILAVLGRCADGAPLLLPSAGFSARLGRLTRLAWDVHSSPSPQPSGAEPQLSQFVCLESLNVCTALG
jgi:hypothetical protein